MKLYNELFLEQAAPSDEDVIVGEHTFSIMLLKDSDHNMVSSYDYFDLENVRVDMDNGRVRFIPELFADGLEIVKEKHLIRSVKLDDDREIDLEGYFVAIQDGATKLIAE